MTIDEWFFQFLRGTDELSEKLGGEAAFRLYPEQAPQNAEYPHGTYTRIDTPQMYHLDGPSNLLFPRIQLDWWDNRSGGVKVVRELAKLTREAKGGNADNRRLDGFAGTWNGLKIQRCECVDESYSSEPGVHADDLPFRRASMDWVIHYSEIDEA